MDTAPADMTASSSPQCPAPPTTTPQGDPRDRILQELATTLDQVRYTAQQTDEQHKADIQQLRQDLLAAQSLQQATQAAEFQRLMATREQETRDQREQAERRWQQELQRQQQEAAASTQQFTQQLDHLKHQQTASRHDQARLAETTQGTQLILADILRKLSELSTSNQIGQAPNQQADHVYPTPNDPPDWDTPAPHLPLRLRNAQIQYRDRAIYETTETSQAENLRSTTIQNFLREFRQIKHRNPQPSDFPHYRSTDLSPDTTRIDYTTVYLPTILNLTLRLAALGAPPTPADPLFPGTIDTQATHHRNWTILRERMTSPTPELEELEFNRQFMGLTNRSPTGEDIPTWSRIVLTQDPPLRPTP